MFTTDNWEEDFRQAISSFSDDKLLKWIIARNHVEGMVETEDLQNFPFADEILTMRFLFYDELTKRFSDYVLRNVSPNKPAKLYKTSKDLERRYCRKCKDKDFQGGCKGCPIFAKLEVMREEEKVEDSLIGEGE